MLLRCIIIACLIAISSCSSGLKRDLGLIREVPDEFRVISQPDLSIPPNFDLVPPAYPVQNYNFGQQNRAIVDSHLTKDEEEFISILNLPQASNNIRDDITSENVSHDYTKSKTVISRLKAIVKKDDQDSIVSPVEENKRIQNNIKNNKKIDEGDVASTKKEKTIIDKVIGK